MSNTLASRANAPARFTARVVLPVPPLALTMATTGIMYVLPYVVLYRSRVIYTLFTQYLLMVRGRSVDLVIRRYGC